MCCYFFFFFFKQKTAYEMRISDWSSDVCSSDLCVWGRRALDTDREARPVRGRGNTVSDGGVKRQRRSQGERSEEMRERVAHATFEVIAARGFSGLRTAAVAEQAGVSQGALLHHFETKNGLTLATVEFAFARASAKTEAIIAQGLAKGIDPIDMMLSDFRLFLDRKSTRLNSSH